MPASTSRGEPPRGRGSWPLRGRSRTSAAQSRAPATVTAPTMIRAPRQERLAASAASGALPMSAPRTPTVAVERGHHAELGGREPVRRDLERAGEGHGGAEAHEQAPDEERERSCAASPMASEPRPITRPPAAITQRGPTLSISRPPGTMKPA